MLWTRTDHHLAGRQQQGFARAPILAEWWHSVVSLSLLGEGKLPPTHPSGTRSNPGMLTLHIRDHPNCANKCFLYTCLPCVDLGYSYSYHVRDTWSLVVHYQPPGTAYDTLEWLLCSEWVLLGTVTQGQGYSPVLRKGEHFKKKGEHFYEDKRHATAWHWVSR